ncbi:hypothetical protein GCM10010156_63450 [Planobispora rosea]|uniref:Uncharacterized protein n=1 Tax=Planobispora rosea TaxID=35762 RepID=A0A8J3S6D5_PLARO|nr:hypothetical protein GCM10010156_63450 [Planobispora rosea]GIH87644.1 hypothetical protein Pro02_60520 [Planobispora rosea]
MVTVHRPGEAIDSSGTRPAVSGPAAAGPGTCPGTAAGAHPREGTTAGMARGTETGIKLLERTRLSEVSFTRTARAAVRGRSGASVLTGSDAWEVLPSPSQIRSPLRAE